MSCCGQGRAAAASGAAAAPVRAAAPSRKPAYGPVVLEYVGKTSLTVVGPATQKQYHFSVPGARVSVDGRDSVSMAAIRQLRVV